MEQSSMVITGCRSFWKGPGHQNRSKKMTPDLSWIPGPWRGRLAIAARPRGGDWLQDEVSGWRQAGIDIVVSLLEGDEAEQLELGDEGKAVSTDGLIFISFPIPDRGVPSSTPAAGALMSRIAESLEDGKTIAVHCRQGIGRSGLIAIGVLMVSGLSSSRRFSGSVPRVAGKFRRPPSNYPGRNNCPPVQP